MLHIKQHNNGTKWTATVTIAGQTYRASATQGAGNKLAKMLRNMGIKDQPIRIYNPSGKLSLERSLYAWADFDYIATRRAAEDAGLL